LIDPAQVAETHAPPPAAPGTHARRVRRFFDTIAPRYDLGNRLFSAGLDHRWRSRTAALLGDDAGPTVLDLCCGTADLATAVLKRPVDRRVIACDFSRPMLRAARRKLCEARLARRVTLVETDALRLPLADRSVDAAVCAFGLRNLADPEAGLAEVARVVRPGGRVLVLEFHRPPRDGWPARLFRLYFRRLLPRLGAWLSGSRAYAYLVDSIEAFGPIDRTAERMRRAGLDAVHVEPLPGGVAAAYVARRAAGGAV